MREYAALNAAVDRVDEDAAVGFDVFVGGKGGLLLTDEVVVGAGNGVFVDDEAARGTTVFCFLGVGVTILVAAHDALRATDFSCCSDSFGTDGGGGGGGG